MNLISKFTEIYEDCIDYYKSIETKGFKASEEINCTEDGWNNILAHGDNMQFMKYLLEDLLFVANTSHFLLLF